MIEQASNVQTGMDVYSQDGEKVGCVSVVWPHLPAREGAPLEPEQPLTNATEAGYFQVDRGGVLGVGAAHWYVPFGEIAEIVPGERITLSCSGAECEERYSEQPWFAGTDMA